MTVPAARRTDLASGGRHRARASAGWLLPLLVGLLVVGAVGLGATAATRLGAGPGQAAAPTVSLGTASATPEPSAAQTPVAAPAGTAPSQARPPSVPDDASGAVAPGDRIPGPVAPLQPVDDVTPTSLRVPSIAIDVPLSRLGLQPDGAIEVPQDPDEAGWLAASAVPGRTGPAVVAGHVDSATGVAVFTRLGELAPGDEVEVGLSDGTSVRYVVTGSERYPKDAFPSAEVYGPAPASLLRLITCGGTFDRAARSYRDNLVVYAVPAT